MTTAIDATAAAGTGMADDFQTTVRIGFMLLDEQIRTLTGTMQQNQVAARDMGATVEQQSTLLSRFRDVSVALNQGTELISRGFRAVAESGEAFFRGTEDGRATLEGLTARFDDYKGALFSVIIGTSDTAVAGERLNAVLDDVGVVLDVVVGILQPIATVVLTPFRVVLSEVANVIEVFTWKSRLAGDETEEFAGHINRATGEVEELGKATEKTTGSLMTMSEGLSTAFGGSLTAQLQEVDSLLDELYNSAARNEAMTLFPGVEKDAASLRRLTDAYVSGGDIGQMLDSYSVAGRRATEVENELLDRREQILDQLQALDGGYNATTERINAMYESTSAESAAVGELIQMLDLLNQKRKEQSEGVYEVAAAQAELVRAMAEEIATSMEAAKFLGSDAQAANTDALKRGIEEKNDALIRHNDLTEAAEARSRAFQSISENALGSVYGLAEATAGAFADGMGSAADDANAIIGEIVNSLAMAATAMIPVLSVPPFGNPMVGVAVAAAVGAMRAVAGRLGASGGGDAGGASVAASTPQYNTANSLYIVNNMGDVGRMSDVGSLNMDQIRYAKEQGFFASEAA